MDPALLIIKASVVLLVALGIAEVLRRKRAGVAHKFWTAVFVAVLTLPAVAAVVPAIAVPFPSTWYGTSQSSVGIEAVPSAPEGPYIESADNVRIAEVTGAGVDTARSSLSRAEILVFAWISGVCVALVALALSLFRGHRLVRTSTEVVDSEFLAASGAIAGRLGLRAVPRLLANAAVAMPMAGGIMRPVVFLPATAVEWPVEQRDIVLTHELIHLADRDPLRHLIGRLALAVYWFHPLAWLAGSRAAMAREAACDEAVVAFGVRRSTYARVLLTLADGIGKFPGSVAALPIVQRSHLEKRIMGILKGDTRPGNRALVTLSALGAFLLAASVAAVQPKAALDATPLPVPPPRPLNVGVPIPRTTPAAFTPVQVATGPDSCFQPNDADTNSGNGTKPRDTRVLDSAGGVQTCVRFTYGGDVNYRRSSELLALATRAVLETQGNGRTLRMELLRQPSGDLRTAWTVNSVTRPLDANAQAWQASLLGIFDTTWERLSLEVMEARLQEQIDGIQREVPRLRGEIATIHDHASMLKGRIAAAGGLQGSIHGNPVPLQNEVDYTKGLIAGLQGSSAPLNLRTEEMLAEAKARLKLLEERLSSSPAIGDVSALEAELRAYDEAGRIADVERRILDGELRMAVLSGQLRDANLAGRSAELQQRREAEVERLRTAVAAIR